MDQRHDAHALRTPAYAELYAEFVDRYRHRLPDALGDRSPYFYTFKRVLFWGKLPA